MGETSAEKIARFAALRQDTYEQALAGLDAGTYSANEVMAHTFAEAHTTGAMLADVLAEVDGALAGLTPTLEALRSHGIMGLLRGVKGAKEG
jgi:hypothetical protein